jgi:hypothetical protein
VPLLPYRGNEAPVLLEYPSQIFGCHPD